MKTYMIFVYYVTIIETKSISQWKILLIFILVHLKTMESGNDRRK